jgi:hypothetical protein
MRPIFCFIMALMAATFFQSDGVNTHERARLGGSAPFHGDPTNAFFRTASHSYLEPAWGQRWMVAGVQLAERRESRSSVASPS